jgi:hypothetical protein
MRVVTSERLETSAGKDFEIDPADGEDRQEMEKDAILTERTYRSIENKGLNFLKRPKRTGF